MDITTFTSLISTVGFPIAACAALWWSMQKQDHRHREEIDKIRETVENNTRAVLELTFLIKEGRRDETDKS